MKKIEALITNWFRDLEACMSQIDLSNHNVSYLRMITRAYLNVNNSSKYYILEFLSHIPLQTKNNASKEDLCLHRKNQGHKEII